MIAMHCISTKFGVDSSNGFSSTDTPSYDWRLGVAVVLFIV